MSDEYNDVQYVGTVAGLIEKKAGWHSVEIHVPGKQYPVKADTKLENLLTQVREIRDGDLVATFTVRESESENINEKTGKPYTERRLQKVEPGHGGLVASAPQNAPNANVSPSDGMHGPTGSGGGMTKEEWNRKDSAIHKMACIKTAAAALTHTVPSAPTNEDLDKFYRDVMYLTNNWLRSVKAERDDPAGEDVPF